MTSGAYFGMKYQPGTFIYRLDESTTVFTPTFPIDWTVHVHTHSPPSTATIIGLPSYDAPNVYTVSFRDGSVSEYTDNLLSLVPDHNLPTQPSLLPSWIQGVSMQHYFLGICQNPNMALCRIMTISGHFILGNKCSESR